MAGVSLARHPAAGARPVVIALAGLALLAMLAGCGPSGGSALPGSPGATGAATDAAATSGPGVTSGPGESLSADQSDTEWGPIWDTVPAGFPALPGSTTSEIGSDPASEVRVVGGAEPTAIASWYDEALRAAAFRTDGLSGPFEDGSYVVDLSGQSGCRVQVRVAPTGGLSTIVVMYGASCPHG